MNNGETEQKLKVKILVFSSKQFYHILRCFYSK